MSSRSRTNNNTNTNNLMEKYPLPLMVDEEEGGEGRSQRSNGSGSDTTSSSSASSSSGLAIVEEKEKFHDEETLVDDEVKTTKTTTMSPRRKKKMMMAGVALMLLVAIACLVVIPVVVINNNDNNSNEAVAAEVDEETTTTNDNELEASGVTATVTETETETSFPQVPVVPPEDTVDVNTDIDVDADVATGSVPLPLPLFSKEIIQPERYSTRQALEDDLRSAAMEMARNVIVQNAAWMDKQEHSNSLGDVSTRSSDTSQVPHKSRSVNREAGVEEADSVKEDGTFVYAAYGDYLVVWNRHDGQMVTQEQMPTPLTGNNNNAHAWIQAVQLTDHHVLVFAAGYGVYPEESMTLVRNETKLQVYTKPTIAEPILTLVATQTINGHYLNSRYLQASDTGSIHVVSGNDINVKQYLRDPLDPVLNPFLRGLNRTQYMETAEVVALEHVIPAFVTRLADELIRMSSSSNNNGNDELPSSMMQVNAWNHHHPTPPESPGMNPTATLDESFRAYVQILSINPKDLPTEEFVSIEDSLKVSTTGFLGPSAYPHVHAAEDSIVMSVERFDFNAETEATNVTTFLLHYKVAIAAAAAAEDEGATELVTTSLYAVTALTGHLPDPYSVDLQGDDLRVVATRQHSFIHENLQEECGVQPQTTQPSIMIMAPTSAVTTPDQDECLTTDNWNICHDLVVIDGCNSVEKTGCPYIFTCANTESSSGESTTENVVVVYDLGSAGEMIERGRASFGNAHETTKSVTFGKTFLYAVTSFDSNINGRFHVMDLPLGQGPSVKSSSLELDIVPTYLQSLNADGTLVLGIGQNATGKLMNQVLEGVMVHVYDLSSSSEQPVVVASRSLNNDPLTSSKTVSSYDPKAVQYTDSGLLLVPLTLEADMMALYAQMVETNSTFTYEQMAAMGFEGFVVLDVSKSQEEGIEELFRVNHRPATGSCNHCNGVLPNHRSFVYEDDGSVMTMLNHMVASTNLATLEQTWAFNVTFEGLDSSCCF